MEAQISALCQFCEISTEIRCKCINCDLFLCRICNSKIHSKIKSANEHKVISLEECGSDNTFHEMRKHDLYFITCLDHRNRHCVMYCGTCTHPICATCIKENHKEHKLFELDKKYSENYEELVVLRENIDADLSFWNQEEDHVIKLKSDIEENYLQIKLMILKLQNSLDEKTTTKSQILKEMVENECRLIQNELRSKMQILSTCKRDLENKERNVLKYLKSHSASDILTASSNLKRDVDVKHQCQIQVQPFRFIHGEYLLLDIGVIHEVENFDIDGFYKIPLGSNKKMCIYKNECIFYSEDDYINGTIHRVQFQENDTQIEKNTGVSTEDVTDMAVTNDGQIILLDGDYVVLLKENGEMRVILGVPYSDYGESTERYSIHVNSRNSLLVGLKVVKRYEFDLDIHTHRCGKITEYSEEVYEGYEGKVYNNYIGYEGNQWVISETEVKCIPFKLLSTKNDDLFIMYESSVEKESNYQQQSWEYNGCSRCQKDSFHPVDMAESPSGLLFIISSTFQNNLIHIVNQDAETLTCSLLYYQDIPLGVNLAFDECGKLLIVCENIVKDEAHIYRLKLENNMKEI